jgi:glycosyltransferase involved in cell wall biosynthesis
MIPTLYITRNGMLEPLGQSQVLAYLRGLSAEYRITLISFEKPEDLADTAAMARVQEDCAAHGIRWLPQRFRYRPRVIAPAVSMVVFLALCLGEVRRGNAALIHARSYMPAGVALIVGRLTGVPFIFDMRALWPEEMITAGQLRRGSLIHRAIAWAERACLGHAATVVSLTHAAVDHLRRVYPAELINQRVVVIPTCADLDRFVPKAQVPEGPRVYGCVGTVLSGWFRLDWLAAFFRTAADRDPQARFHIITRDDPAQVLAAIGGGEALQQRLEIYAKAPQEMQEAVQRQSVSVMFYTQGLSSLGRSPTRMGEILGCGLPVVANAGVGDVERIITQYRVGVLAKDGSAEAMGEALDELNELCQDPELPARCGRAAEEVFSLSSGTEAYRRIYAKVLGGDTAGNFGLEMRPSQ